MYVDDFKIAWWDRKVISIIYTYIDLAKEDRHLNKAYGVRTSTFRW